MSVVDPRILSDENLTQLFDTCRGLLSIQGLDDAAFGRYMRRFDVAEAHVAAVTEQRDAMASDLAAISLEIEAVASASSLGDASYEAVCGPLLDIARRLGVMAPGASGEGDTQ